MTGNQSAQASLDEKFAAFASSLTEDEAALFGALIQSVNDEEVSGFELGANLNQLGLPHFVDTQSRTFDMLSNIMKTKHDTAKNSISNVR